MVREVITVAALTAAFSFFWVAAPHGRRHCLVLEVRQKSFHKAGKHLEIH